MFDIYLYPIHLINRQEQPGLAGFLATNAPRRAARNRAGDILVIQMTLSGTQVTLPALLESYPKVLAEDYFKTSGSVTAGIRAAVENLNEIILKKNLENVRTGQTTTGVLNMAVVHNDALFVVHAGQAHSIVVSQKMINNFYDPGAEHGLGVSRSAALRYYQTELHAGDILTFWNRMPLDFAANLQSVGEKYTLEQFRRRVLSLVDADEHIAMIQFQTGKGQLHMLKARPGQADQAEGRGKAAGETPMPAERPVPQAPVPIEKPVPQTSEIGETLTPVAKPVPQTSMAGEIPEPIEKPVPQTSTPAEKPLPAADDLIPISQETQQIIAPIKPGETSEATVPKAGEAGTSSSIRAQAVQGSSMPGRVHAEPPTSARREGEKQAKPDKSGANWLNKLTALIPTRAAKTNEPVAPQPDEPLGSEEQIAMRPAAFMPEKRTVQEKPVKTPPASPEMGDKSTFRKRLASLWRGGRKASQRVGADGTQLLTNILPGETNRPLQLSPAIMLFIAVAVPLIVVSLATTIYFRNGPGKQHQTYLAQAQALDTQAKKQADMQLKYNTWQQVIGLLDKAEKYEISDGSRALRTRVQQYLDDTDGIVRLNFQPIANTLDSSIHVDRMEANASEVYLLDSAQGRIFRLFNNGQGANYNIDASFNCGPGAVGSNVVGPLVGMALLPSDAPNKATVMGMDAAGNLLFCIPGSPPLSNVLPSPEKTIQLGKVVNFKLDGNVLYVLDSKNNSVYNYLGNNLAFADRPHLFFDNQVPTLTNVADMEINGEDLYLLHEDGKMSKCTLRAFPAAQTRCLDPSPYKDSRTGREGETQQFANTHFIEIQATESPDPSLFILDAMSSTLFQFGLSQTLHRQIRMQIYPEFTLPSRSASAFAIAANRVVWMAYGNEIFYAPLQ